MIKEAIPLKVGSLFSGIGGLDLGFEWAGFQVIYQVEIDAEARKILARHWPDVPKYEDIRDINPFPSCDILVGGFPCQDISQANNHAMGISGPKSSLWAEYLRAIKQVEPAYVVIENVSALRYLGRGFGSILQDLADIGYNVEWQVLPASFVGAPHKRARMWVVAYPNSHSQPNLPFDAKTQVMPKPCCLDWSWVNPPKDIRMDDGVSRKLDRSRRKQLGNAVVPAAAYYIAEAIKKREQKRT